MQEASRNAIFWFFLGVFLASCFMLGWLLLPFLSIFVVAAVVTGLFKPIHAFFEARMRRSAASVVTCGIIFLVLFIPIVLFVGILSKEAYDLYLMARGVGLRNHIQELLQDSRLLDTANSVLSTINLQVDGETVKQAVPEIGRAVGLFLYEQANAIASNILKFILNFLLMLLVIYYLLIDGDRLIDFIVDLSPLPDDQDEKLIGKFKEMAGAILVGNGLCGILQGAVGGFVFALFGLKSAFLWAAVMSLLAFLPILGIGLVFLPAALYLFLKGRIVAGIALALIYVMLSGGVEYLLKPKLVGKTVRMHTLLVFLAILGGLNLFGILGILYGPLVVTAFLTLTDIYHTSYQNLVRPPAAQ